MTVTPQEILDELKGLNPDRWVEVRYFIALLKCRDEWESRHSLEGSPEADHKRVMTGQDWLESGLAGMWADRADIGDSVEFARKLRREAERQLLGTPDNMPMDRPEALGR